MNLLCEIADFFFFGTSISFHFRFSPLIRNQILYKKSAVIILIIHNINSNKLFKYSNSFLYIYFPCFLWSSNFIFFFPDFVDFFRHSAGLSLSPSDFPRTKNFFDFLAEFRCFGGICFLPRNSRWKSTIIINYKKVGFLYKIWIKRLNEIN